MNVENLLKLANYLDNVAVTSFHMGSYMRDEHDEMIEPQVHECGTVACAAGYGPAAGLAPLPDELGWPGYVERVFGLDLHNADWEWCFSSVWTNIDNTPSGAAKRIRHLVLNGLPLNWSRQLYGEAPYLFA